MDSIIAFLSSLWRSFSYSISAAWMRPINALKYRFDPRRIADQQVSKLSDRLQPKNLMRRGEDDDPDSYKPPPSLAGPAKTPAAKIAPSVKMPWSTKTKPTPGQTQPMAAVGTQAPTWSDPDDLAPVPQRAPRSWMMPAFVGFAIVFACISLFLYNRFANTDKAIQVPRTTRTAVGTGALTATLQALRTISPERTAIGEPTSPIVVDNLPTAPTFPTAVFEPTQDTGAYPTPGGPEPGTNPPPVNFPTVPSRPTSNFTPAPLPPTRAPVQPTIPSEPIIPSPIPPELLTPSATSIPTETPIPPTATPIPPTATATPIPKIIVSGSQSWNVADGPVVLDRDTVVVAGSSLIIGPGVEVQLKPGVELAIEGNMVAQGTPNSPVRFIGPGGNWGGMFIQPGGSMTLSHAEIRQGGRGGVAIGGQGGSLVVRDSLLTASSGGISTSGTNVDIRRTQITGNNFPYGPAVQAQLSSGRSFTMAGNIIGGNQLNNGTPQVQLRAFAEGSGPLDIQGNIFYGSTGSAFDIATGGDLHGTLACNSFNKGTIGLSVSSSTQKGDGYTLDIKDNSFTEQTIYGASSTVGLNAPNNWWGEPNGPYDAQRNPDGLGKRVGVNVNFAPWLNGFPACAPRP